MCVFSISATSVRGEKAGWDIERACLYVYVTQSNGFDDTGSLVEVWGAVCVGYRLLGF